MTDIWDEKPNPLDDKYWGDRRERDKAPKFFRESLFIEDNDAWLDKVGRFIGNLENDIADLKETERNWLEQEKAYLNCIDELKEKAEKFDLLFNDPGAPFLDVMDRLERVHKTEREWLESSIMMGRKISEHQTIAETEIACQHELKQKLEEVKKIVLANPFTFVNDTSLNEVLGFEKYPERIKKIQGAEA